MPNRSIARIVEPPAFTHVLVSGAPACRRASGWRGQRYQPHVNGIIIYGVVDLSATREQPGAPLLAPGNQSRIGLRGNEGITDSWSFVFNAEIGIVRFRQDWQHTNYLYRTPC